MSPCLFLSPAFHSMEKELHVWMEAESRLDGSGGGGAIGTHRVPREGLWEIQKAVSASKPYAKVTRHFSPRCTTCSTSVTISSELFRRRNRSCTRDSSSLCPLDTMVSNQWRNTAEEEEAAGTRLLIDGRTCLLQEFHTVIEKSPSFWELNYSESWNQNIRSLRGFQAPKLLISLPNY
ncbi:uncharacterized protein LOC114383305 [Glycine soja]|uniref:uncharacterized protein LOC114383305 n=1 Tax=Glycine soja TaxID=3848 RepID=UPI00104005C1|nr:uncharacterized protein LOC114383305 [Glycine soja]